MTTKKKNETSTESSSGSSSGSSSSSSSSSGSDSSSSSDSESSSSHSSTKNQSEPETITNSNKKPTSNSAVAQKGHRKSTETSVKANTSSSSKTESKPAPKAKAVPVKQVKQPAKNAGYSSEDETDKKQVKRKSNVKPKSSATITPKSNTTVSQTKLSKSGQTAPAIKSSSKTTPNTKTNNHKEKPQKTSSQKATASAAKVVVDDPKKKSIFSPENSSDSESPKPVSKNGSSKSSGQVKAKPEPRPKAAAKPVEKPKVVEKKVEKPPKVTKVEEESSETTTTTSSGSSSSSDTDTTAESSEKDRKVQKPVKKPTVVPKEEPANSESEPELTAKSKQVTRKFTRSSNTRKSKHVMGKNVDSESDSDTESTKRSLSHSPVKKAPVVTKGKSKNKREDSKLKAETQIIERKCPLEGCDSNGHLSGKFDKHFTVEACPIYHNTTAERCRLELVERKKREEWRKKALDLYNKSQKSSPTPDQKQYLIKIKDLRAKFKMEPMEDIKPVIDKNREPDLNNFVPEYDLKLFRDAQAAVSEKIEDDLKSLPSTKGTKSIEMGKFDMEVWYQSPYPEDYARVPKLYICEYCLRYMKTRTILQRHVMKCVWRHPPGEEVYRKEKISVWEVDGKRYKQYCQNLCLLAKFFLDHKTLYYDVEPFLFYVMTLVDNEGCHTVGYFSKEKNSFLNYNVSCILTLPPYQRQGYGRLLIDFSYLLTRVEGKIGSPEKPLSDLGLISYRSYWKDVLLGYLCARPGTQLSVKDISQEMAIHSYDIVSTLQALGMMKYWKGKHIILKKQDVLDEYVERVKRRGSMLKKIDPACLRWNPVQPAPV